MVRIESMKPLAFEEGEVRGAKGGGGAAAYEREARAISITSARPSSAAAWRRLPPIDVAMVEVAPCSSSSCTTPGVLWKRAASSADSPVM